ncbi:hypothetical protein K9L16_01590 [Candidatus Pacearchaeota archaeon]|nr:hypothetical protein [Candidatus Pacearchaeota archaeon]
MAEQNSKIQATLILEIIGKPPEHLKETLNSMIENIKKEKGIEIKKSDVKEPEKLKDSKEFFTTFAEVEIQAETIMHMIGISFKYMPSHIEIFYPEKFKINNLEWNDVFNEIVRRLHGYDEVAKVLQIQNQQLQEQVKKLQEKDSEEISKEKPDKK